MTVIFDMRRHAIVGQQLALPIGGRSAGVVGMVRIHIAQMVLDGMMHDIVLADIYAELIENILRRAETAVPGKAQVVVALFMAEVGIVAGAAVDDDFASVRSRLHLAGRGA